VDILHSGRLRDHKDLIAAVQLLPAEIIGRQILTLQMRAGRPVEHQHLLAEHLLE